MGPRRHGIEKEVPMTRAMALAALSLLTAVPGLAQEADTHAPVCIYNSRSFSEGASICVQRHLMMNCMLAETRAVWKVVTDRNMRRMCMTPSRPAVEAVAPPRRLLARRMPAPAATAKCFTFNGRRFCE
jgi:hypothetical protein